MLECKQRFKVNAQNTRKLPQYGTWQISGPWSVKHQGRSRRGSWLRLCANRQKFSFMEWLPRGNTTSVKLFQARQEWLLIVVLMLPRYSSPSLFLLQLSAENYQGFYSHCDKPAVYCSLTAPPPPTPHPPPPHYHPHPPRPPHPTPHTHIHLHLLIALEFDVWQATN